MSQKRLSMRKIRELMRLKYELGRSHREIAASLGVANSTVSDYAGRARAAGLSWPLPEGLDDCRAGGGAVPPASALAGPPSRAGLGPGAPGASAPGGRHAQAVVAGVPDGASGRLPVQQLSTPRHVGKRRQSTALAELGVKERSGIR